MGAWAERYKYTDLNVKTHAPEAGGVYRLMHRIGVDSHSVFYIGKTDNLRNRLLEHLSDSETNLCIKNHLGYYTCYFRFIEADTQEKRNSIEKEQIQEYNPNCNSL